MADDVLFVGNSLHDVLRVQEKRLGEFVLGMDPDVVLTTPEEDLLDRIVAQFEVACPVLLKDKQYSPQGATDVRIDVTGDFGRATFGPGPHYVPGTRFSLHVPFEGEREVFFYGPSSYDMNPPRANVVGQEIILTVEAPADTLDPAAMRAAFDRSLSDIERYLGNARSQIEPFNAVLRDKARGVLTRRREKVLADRALEAHLAVPVARRSDQAAVLSVDVPKKRRAVETVRPKTTAMPFQPEPAISRDDFEAIVEVVASFGAAVERFPDTFSPMPEPVLREIVLVILNNQFGGPAVGELFSRKGKTDIAIVQGHGPVFIGECKIWEGEKAFREAIDQLLGYLVWRDTRSAAVLFVRNKDVTRVVSKAVACLRSHERFKRIGSPAGSHPVFVLHHEGDPNREIEVALVVVPIPAPAAQSADVSADEE